MLVPLFVLAAGAVLAGVLFQKYFIGAGYDAFWKKALFTGKDNHILHDMHAIPGWVGWAPFCAMASGLALSWLYYIKAPWLPAATARTFEPIYQFFLNKWYFDELYDFLFVRPALWIGSNFGRSVTAESSTVSAPTASRPACRTRPRASSSCRPATSTTMPSP